MYKIEKFLIEHDFELVRGYSSGVVVYSDAKKEWEYTTEVVIFINKKIWEMVVHNPYAMNLQGYKEYDENNFVETHKVLAADHVDYAFGFKKWLEEQVENPWEEI